MYVTKQKRGEFSVENITHKKLIVAHPDNSILEAFEKMKDHEIGRILIVNEKNPKETVLCFD